MNPFIKSWVVSMMEDTLKRIKEDRCSLDEVQQEMLLDVLAEKILNKGQSADFVHLSQDMFDKEVAQGRIPEGKKIIKNDSRKYWVKRDLIYYIKMREMTGRKYRRVGHQ